MRTIKMTRTSKSKQEAMGIKTVWIQNQCTWSSTEPGKSQGDTDPQQLVHHHGSGVSALVTLLGGY